MTYIKCVNAGLTNLLKLLVLLLMLSPMTLLNAAATSVDDKSAQVEKAPSGPLVIVTDYPKVLTDEFRRAFIRSHPKIVVDVHRMGTGTGVEYLKTNRNQNIIDLFWVSAPDAMETLKKEELLEKYSAQSLGIPNSVSGYPTSDPEGYYSGFAASGYGLMWNERYVDAKQLSEPLDWEVITSADYFDHVGMSAPSRSGTTHLAVESILQAYGWQEGWRLVRKMGGNARSITKKSYDVPKGVVSGEFGAGVVIDFYGLAEKARRHPVRFAYPEKTSIVPASIALLKNSPNPAAAQAFVDFILSEEGQSLLLHPDIQRLPLRSEIYARAPDDYPNPFKDPELENKPLFDAVLSAHRYVVIDALFDVMVTFNLDSLKAATLSLHQVRDGLKDSSSEEARQLLRQAEALMDFNPVSESEAERESLTAIFKQKRKTADDELEGEQATLELRWQKDIAANYIQAKSLADAALELLQ